VTNYWSNSEAKTRFIGKNGEMALKMQTSNVGNEEWRK
jgi:hypothetical protein